MCAMFRTRDATNHYMNMKKENIVTLGWLFLAIFCSAACWLLTAEAFASYVGWKQALLETVLLVSLPLLGHAPIVLDPKNEKRHRRAQWVMGLLALVGLIIGRAMLEANFGSRQAMIVLVPSNALAWGVLGTLCWGKLYQRSVSQRQAAGTNIPPDPSVN